MTFRRLFTADGIHNYFWKARPVRAALAGRRLSHGSHGIKDRVAIVGMGCTPFGEHWDKGLDDLIVDAANEAFASAGVDKDDVDAYWFGTAQSGMSGITLARPLQLDDKPVTRVENYCATGSEALRQAAYAVASGAYDVAMAVGVEKVKDCGYQGLNAFPIRRTTAPAARSPRRRCSAWSRPRTPQQYGVDADELREALARIASKNHDNGARNPRAQFRTRDVASRRSATSPDGGRASSACSTAPAWPTARPRPSSCRAEDAHQYTDKPLYVKALSFVAGNGGGLTDPTYDYTHFPEIERGARDAYAQAGHHRSPRTSSPWPRCTTASPPPSWCSWRTSGSPSAARRGATSSTASSTSTASCRSTPTAGSSPSATRSARRVCG